MQLALALIFSVVLLASSQAQVLPSDSVVEGKSIGEWSAEWWKWAFLTPTNQHPLFDTTGAWATNGQPNSSVFFLAGIYGFSGVAQRTFSVPEGKYLFLPVVNVSLDNIDVVPALPVEQMRDVASAYIDTFLELHASIDGVSISNLSPYRVTSPVFNVVYPDANNLSSWFAHHPIVGLLDPIVSDGYWLMVEPLPPGTHVINFGGKNVPPSDFIIDLTDTIHVVPIPLSDRVHGLIASLDAPSLCRNHLRQLVAILRVAESAFKRGRTKAGINHLRAFQSKVRHLITRCDQELADQLIQAAQQIIDRARLP